MRESERAALQTALDQVQSGINSIVSILGGKVPTAAAPAPTAKVSKAAAAVPTGQANIGVDSEGNFGCLIDNQGPFSVGEAAIHAFQEHGIKLVDIVVEPAEQLTHGRKWMMKKALEKAGLTKALEGYGRGAAKAVKPAKPAKAAKAAAPAPAVPEKKKRKWFKDERGKWKKVKEGAPAAPAAQVAPAAPAKKTWMKKGAPAAAVAGGAPAFQKKYNLTDEQMAYVQKFAAEKSLGLEEAAEKIALEEAGA